MFRKKRLGWGLEPGSPAGWAFTLGFVIIEIGGVLAIGRFTTGWPLVAWAAFWLVSYVIVAISTQIRT